MVLRICCAGKSMQFTLKWNFFGRSFYFPDLPQYLNLPYICSLSIYPDNNRVSKNLKIYPATTNEFEHKMCIRHKIIYNCDHLRIIEDERCSDGCENFMVLNQNEKYVRNLHWRVKFHVAPGNMLCKPCSEKAQKKWRQLNRGMGHANCCTMTIS